MSQSSYTKFVLYDVCDHGIAFPNAILVGDYDVALSNI